MRKGIGAWLILGGILAVPAFLFWNWSKGMNPSRSTRSIVNLSGHPFSTIGARPAQNFPPIQSQRTAPVNPGNTAPSALPAARPMAVAGAGPNLSGSARMTGGGPGQAPGTIAATATGMNPAAPVNRSVQGPSNSAHGAFAPSAAVPQARAFTSTMAVASVIAFNPATDRDPTLSPREIEVLKERLEAPHKAPPPHRKVERKPAPERRVRVSGIVQVGSRSFTAIVNDQIHKVGDTVNGCKILKISSSMVTFQFKDKKFSKTVPK